MALQPVIVTNAPGGLITQSGIDSGIEAIIRVPADTGYGDLVSFHWGNVEPLQKAYTPGNFPNFSWVVDILTAFPPQEVLSDGTYAVYFTILDYDNHLSTSPVITITVQGSNIKYPDFAAPEVQSVINQAQWIAGFNVTIPASAAIRPGDIYEIFLRANNTVHSVKEGIAPNSGPIIVPSDPRNPALDEMDGVNGFFYYTISRGNPLAVVGTSSSRLVYIDVVPPRRY